MTVNRKLQTAVVYLWLFRMKQENNLSGNILTCLFCDLAQKFTRCHTRQQEKKKLILDTNTDVYAALRGAVSIFLMLKKVQLKQS